MNQVNQRVEGTPARSIPPAKMGRGHGLTLFASSLVVGTALVFAWAIPARSSINPPVPASPVLQGATLASVEENRVPPLELEERPVADVKLSKYLADSALTWVQKARSWNEWPDCSGVVGTREHERLCANYEKVEHETTNDTRKRIESIAHDVATAATVEYGAWPNDPGNARMAVLVLGLGFEETLFRGYVDDGRCNSKSWQSTPEGINLTRIGGTCDGTLAHSVWQIHTGDGILLLNNKGKGQDWMHVIETVPQRILDEDAKTPMGLRQYVDGENIITDRLLAARTAWRIARQALRIGKFQSLCAYTGELNGVCPKGDIRLNFANGWWQNHPFSPTN
jgi:hypothetical protein